MEKNLDYSKWELLGMPNDIFQINRKRYIKNLRTHAENLKQNSIIVIEGGKEIPYYDTDINIYHFFQESNFYYLTGVREPGFFAILDIECGRLDLFFQQVPEKSKIWLTVPTKEEVANKYGLDEANVHYTNEMNHFIKDRNAEAIYLLDGKNEYTGICVTCATLSFEKEFDELNDLIIKDKLIYEVLCDTRCIKTEKEIDLIKFIADITNEAHLEILKNIRPDAIERDMENIFMRYLSNKYYTRIWAYPCIGGCGKNSAVLHYEKNDVRMKDGDIFLADMGVRFCGYTSDVTQTIPVNGKFSKKQKEIYDIVLKSNRKVISEMKAGETRIRDMDKLSKRVILEELQQLGLIKEGYSIEELFQARIEDVFMPHYIGHYVGLDVHDVGGNVSYKSENILEEGNLITVEPGIYFTDYNMEKALSNPDVNVYLNEQKIREYMEVGGVRIEDDILVLSDSVINLNESLPRTTEEIEEYIKKNNIYFK
jgi:Xaa-Pro dipeptidase